MNTFCRLVFVLIIVFLGNINSKAFSDLEKRLIQAIQITQIIINLPDCLPEQAYYLIASPTKSYKNFPNETLPNKFDWRDQKKVSSAKNQGLCGSCWAFAAATMLESHILIFENKTYDSHPIDISEQQLISCNICEKGCVGGSNKSFKFWERFPPMTESCAPYANNKTATRRNIHFVPCYKLTHCYEEKDGIEPFVVADYYTVNMAQQNYIENIKKSLYHDGPAYFVLTIYDDFSENFWVSFCDNIPILKKCNQVAQNCKLSPQKCNKLFYQKCSPLLGKCNKLIPYIKNDEYVYANNKKPNFLKKLFQQGNHAVSIIGWNDNLGALLCKNSWGDFGPNNDGTFWVSYHEHTNDLNFKMINIDIEKYHEEMIFLDDEL